MGRRKLGVVTTPTADSSSHPCNNNTMSPQSPSSQGTFNGSFELIGHDDSTLIHANIKGAKANRYDRSIKGATSNSVGGIDSFLTTSYSEEDREISHNSTRSNQNNSEADLRQQLNELDQAQEAWKAKQKELAHDTDDIGDFYVKEAGENSLSPSTRKQAGAIYEEEELIENDEHSAELLSYENTATTTTITTTDPNQLIKDQLIQEKTEDDIIKTGKKVSDELVGGLATGSAFIIQPNQHKQEKIKEATTTDKEVCVDVVIDLAAESASLASSVDQSEGSDLDFEYPSTDEHSVNSKRYEACAGEILVKPSGQTTDDAYVDVENDVIFADLKSKKGIKPEDTDEMIREMQKRLHDLPTNIEMSFASDRANPSHNQQSTKYRSWIVVGSGSDGASERSHKNFWGRSRTLASKTDEEGEEDADAGYNRKRRRRKLCIINSCLVLLIIAAIICSVLFAIEISGSQSISPPSFIEGDANSSPKNMWSPTSTPIETTVPSFNIDGNANSGMENTQLPTVSIIESGNVNHSLNKTQQLTSSPIESPSNEIRPESLPAGSLAYESSPENSSFENSKIEGSQGSLDENPLDAQTPTFFPSRYPTTENLPVENPTEKPSAQTRTNNTNLYSVEESSDNLPVGNIEEDSSISSPNQDPLLVDAYPTIENNPTAESLPIENPAEEQTKTNTTIENLPTMSPIPYSDSTKERLENVSGDIVFDVSTPQYDAYDWLLNNDPANLDLDSLTEEELNQRYIAALFYLSLNGKNWADQYGFLEASHVCEWNNGSSRKKMGVICDSPEKITGFAISKYKREGDIHTT
jgi:hypothetical protein